MTSPLRTSLLDAEHRALDARMTPFGGWDMPLQYRSVLDEHRACRAHAVVFDVSHLGAVAVSGPGSFELLQDALTNDLRKIGPGRAQYTHLLDATDASVLDDIIVWWVEEEQLLVIPNASNTSRVLDALGRGVDVTGGRALLAVQGPDARALLAKVVPDAATVAHFGVAAFTFDGVECLVGGTGYTGEDGVELHVPDAGAAVGLWRALLDVGVVPAGLGARDTLRLEMGYPLHGHELGPGITSLQAGLGWVVGWDKPGFRGRAALEAERERGVARRLRGIVAEGRQVPRTDCAVLVDGHPAGVVTSGNFSPVLERGIALALVEPGIVDGTAVEIEIRGRTAGGTVVRPPFIPR
jgi:aminomethyltransferase